MVVTPKSFLKSTGCSKSKCIEVFSFDKTLKLFTMKICKFFITFLIINFTFITVQVQAQSNYVGATCQCGAGQSTCSANCTFSDCCVCWTATTQNGACGCYFGIASCKTEKIDDPKNLTMDENIFGEVNPNAQITFHFDNFKKLITFFDKKGINTNEFKNTINSTSSKYLQINDNAKISNNDFSNLLTVYASLIKQLDAAQKNDLNIFIKSL